VPSAVAAYSVVCAASAPRATVAVSAGTRSVYEKTISGLLGDELGSKMRSRPPLERTATFERHRDQVSFGFIFLEGMFVRLSNLEGRRKKKAGIYEAIATQEPDTESMLDWPCTGGREERSGGCACGRRERGVDSFGGVDHCSRDGVSGD